MGCNMNKVFFLSCFFLLFSSNTLSNVNNNIQDLARKFDNASKICKDIHKGFLGSLVKGTCIKSCKNASIRTANVKNYTTGKKQIGNDLTGCILGLNMSKTKTPILKELQRIQTEFDNGNWPQNNSLDAAIVSAKQTVNHKKVPQKSDKPVVSKTKQTKPVEVVTRDPQPNDSADFEENLSWAPGGYVAHHVSPLRLSRATAKIAKRCQSAGASQRNCQRACANVSSQSLDIHKKLQNLEQQNYQELRAQLDVLDEQMRQCFSAIYKIKEHRTARQVISKLSDWLKEDAWPTAFRDFAANNSPAMEIDQFVFNAPPVPAHVAFAREYLPNQQIPAIRIKKRPFRYEQMSEAYEFANAKGCETVDPNQKNNCEFRCGLNKTRRAIIASAFATNSDRQQAANEIKSMQCADALAESNLRGKNVHIDAIIDFQKAMEYGLFPEDRRPYDQEVRMYCRIGQKGPFQGLKGCEYLSAIYYGDFGKAAALDRRAGEPLAQLTESVTTGLLNNMSKDNQLGGFMNLIVQASGKNITSALRHSFSLSNIMLQTYLTNYDVNYKSCLGPNPVSVTVTKERIREYKNAWNMTTRSERLAPISYTYSFKNKFYNIASSHGMQAEGAFSLGLFDWFARNLREEQLDIYSARYSKNYLADTGVTMEDAILGVFDIFGKKSCSDPVVVQLEDQMLEYSSKFFPKYYKLANGLD